MNFLIKATVPLIVDIISDMITPEGVTEFREDIIKILENAAIHSDLALDDKLLEVFVRMLLLKKVLIHSALIWWCY